MPDRYYVVDLRVADYLGAAKAYRKAFGIEGHVMWEEYEPSGTTRGIHFMIGGLAAFGILSPAENPRGETAVRLAAELREHGDGITLLGAVAPELDGRVRELRARGLEFQYPAHKRVGDEWLNQTEPLHGVSFLWAQHDPGHWESWERAELVSSVPPPTDGTPIERAASGATSIEIAVRDIARADDVLGTFLGASRKLSSDDLAPGLAGIEFPVEGLRAIRVVTPIPGARSARAAAVADFLDRRGDGVFALELAVDDAGRVERYLERVGIATLAPPHNTSRGRHLLSESLFGLHIEYTQT